ncbi:MAG: diaminohydroxyphosphoribosylaminopyrimidine deaminase [Thermoanaerobacteraceae bacterium]|jgi:diaminohydroxyphosphoribosylaminopyrimidine deaminase/5-amino-6-(5-phosphoribosylamino)uracil reductase|uniref:Riboflavin biosynthesis protein RibD n=1 Tax=Biomaibacter acetigenes TaxID=2316383 RepID=A0A3G2RA17_9FIRM|nr:bifunctional diaminohydroxyphosphoribosylaminopyrimidine deaminase/5-amino-6-(5-phosphoribosylamino)uracil reductase RibD [Biomaibacter acetigenes]AYO31577.1 bifunctional diaminohydroxyphosphoribosylaminopyrimidine deaminase/5-amino-6-(5-phosphoribosylamino)uracil reductase RibD [Biomaibacter acetigenes]MDK2879096.1 diaminohydroxyphosphoribosylaminopyrimidine deaminase [Thermoanaerobacteraceae bacterium]MDN5312609.1 diaminohydroxyphosphoribosylaminopyrimidine deaminase [Thermoanaerobacteracea
MDRDKFFMERALRLAEKGVGSTSPNPMVGAVLVKDGEIIGEGFHKKAGEPHAEVLALKQAGERARGAELFVTLEPCSHYGRTPPCVQAIIKAGVTGVVAAMEDPNPLVSGRGIKMLEEAGIQVRVGVMEERARKLNEVFIKYITTKKPFVVGKIAQSLDGKIALSSGISRWITGEPARIRAHELRSRYDAVMVGIGTVLADDPLLTCRLPGREKDPVKIVVDSTLKIPVNARLFQDSGKVIIAATQKADRQKMRVLKELGADIIETESNGGDMVNLPQLFEILGTMGITGVLVEGGSRLLASLSKEELLDKLIIFVAPRLIGAEGLSSVGNLFVDELKKTPRFTIGSLEQIGEDIMLEAYKG